MAAGLWGALAGAGLGIGKHYLSDKPAFQSEAELASTQTRYSPWSKMGMGKMPEKRPSLFNSTMQGAVGGAMQGASMGGGGAESLMGAGGAEPELVSEQLTNSAPSRSLSSPTFGGSYSGLKNKYSLGGY